MWAESPDDDAALSQTTLRWPVQNAVITRKTGTDQSLKRRQEKGGVSGDRPALASVTGLTGGTKSVLILTGLSGLAGSALTGLSYSGGTGLHVPLLAGLIGLSGLALTGVLASGLTGLDNHGLTGPGSSCLTGLGECGLTGLGGSGLTHPGDCGLVLAGLFGLILSGGTSIAQMQYWVNLTQSQRGVWPTAGLLDENDLSAGTGYR